VGLKFLDSLNPLDRRNRISDFLTNAHFQVFDISFSFPLVFLPVYGFRTCTAPEITVNEKSIKEGTFEYPRYVLQGAEVTPIELTQGTRFFNSDFYDWISKYIRGETEQRKNLLIIHYSDIGVLGLPGDQGGLDLGFGVLTDLISRIPARAWMLIETVPTRYKGGSDFDPMGKDISLAELTLRPFYFEEFNTGI